MNRRGFLRLLAGGVAAFRALGFPTTKIERSIFGSGSDGDLVLSDPQTMPESFHRAYDALDLKGWFFTPLPDGGFVMHPPAVDRDEENGKPEVGNQS